MNAGEADRVQGLLERFVERTILPPNLEPEFPVDSVFRYFIDAVEPDGPSGVAGGEFADLVPVRVGQRTDRFAGPDRACRSRRRDRRGGREVTTVADPRDVIIAPVVSEKSYGELNRNWYTFLVHPDANKTQIKIAIQQIFDVRVITVNTLNREGKRKRTRTGWGKRKSTKRALVKLADGDRIEAFGGPVS
jgi:large subunit ribosomal protein L23